MIRALSQTGERGRAVARHWSGLCFAALGALVLVPAPAAAAEFSLVPGQKVVGAITEYVVQPGEGLNEIARKFDLGYTALAAANPGVDQFEPGAGRRLIIPSLYVLPEAPRQGIVINLAQWRLFYFPPGGDRVETYPLGLGVIGKKTPLGASSVVRKEPHPTWYPPASIRAEHSAEGDHLPAFVPPGPNNPLGDYALHLGWKNYLIHGTNKPDGVGRNVSHGCIRMYPEDIERLFSEVSVGVPVRTVNQPAAAGWGADGALYVNVFPSKTQVEEIDIDRPVSHDPADGVDRVVRAAAGSRADSVDWDAVMQAARERTGIPTIVADPSGMARNRARPDYTREAARTDPAALPSYNRDVTSRSGYRGDIVGQLYDGATAGSSYAPDYGQGASYYPPYPSYPSYSYYGSPPAAYPSYNAAPPGQWSSPPAVYGDPDSYRRGAYPWSGSSAW